MPPQRVKQMIQEAHCGVMLHFMQKLGVAAQNRVYTGRVIRDLVPTIQLFVKMIVKFEKEPGTNRRRRKVRRESEWRRVLHPELVIV